MKARLVMTSGSGEHSFPLDGPKTVIGRGSCCDVRVPLLTVGHRHCEISISEEGLEIVDLGSDAGTRVNGDVVERATVRANDTVEVGPVRFRVAVDEEGVASRVAEPKPHARGRREPPTIGTQPVERSERASR